LVQEETYQGKKKPVTKEEIIIIVRTNNNNLCIVGPLSSRHGASNGYGWRIRPPDMEGSCEYIE
jgi:hypothetical protein